MKTWGLSFSKLLRNQVSSSRGKYYKADCNYDCRAKIIRDVLAEVEVVLIIQDQTRKLAERYYKQEYEDSYPASLGRTGLDQHLHTLPSKDAEAGFLGYLRVIIKN